MDKTFKMQAHPHEAKGNTKGHANEDLGKQGKASMYALLSH